MQLEGCVNSVFCRLPWPSGIVTVGMGIRPSGVEDFTSCIVYQYIVQFFNTFYLQQYLCIFYEVIKWITLHRSVFAQTLCCSKSCILEYGQKNRYPEKWSHKWKPVCACASHCWLAAAAAGVQWADVDGITVSCSSTQEMARYNYNLFQTNINRE